MHLLLSAAPRFLNLNVGLLIACSACFHFQAHSYKPLLVLLAVTSILLASSGIVGLIALGNERFTTRRVESIISDFSLLGGQLIVAVTIHPGTLANLLPQPVMAYRPQSLTALAIGAISSLSLVFNVLGEYAVGWRTYLGISLTASSALLMTLVFWRINRIAFRRRLPDRIDWQLLLAVQSLGVIAALDSLRQFDTPVVLLGRFCAPLWLGGISLFLFRLPTYRLKLTSNMNDTSKYHAQRRAEYPSVSEDFRCRDPFAGPLGGSQIPMVLSARSSDARMELLRPSSMFLDLDLSPKAKDLRPESCRRNTRASRPATGDTSQGGSFYTAEVYLDTEPEYEELSSSPRKGGSSTKWLIPKDALDSLPSIPAPAHMPLPINPSRHARSRLGSEAPTEIFPPPLAKIPDLGTRRSQRSLLSTLHAPPLPPSVWAELAEVQDRTPTQSLYLSSTSLNIAIAAGDTGRIPIAIPVDAPITQGEQVESHSRTPSICSLPSIPSTPNTPEQTFGTELSEELAEDSLNTDVLRDSLLLPASLEDDDEKVEQRASASTFL